LAGWLYCFKILELPLAIINVGCDTGIKICIFIRDEMR